MDFTIITPSYNSGHFIADCLHSVAQQSQVSLEHLIMDGGSTDKTGEIVTQFPQTHFYQEPDEGMTEAINKGFAKANGRWVMWLNADDRLRPNALVDVRNFADENPEADVIFGCWNFIDVDGNLIRRMTLFPFQKRMLIYHGCYIASTSTLFKKTSTLDVGFFLDKRFRFVMDGEYYCRLSKAGKQFRYLPKVLADFRLHNDSLSQSHLGLTDMHNILARQEQLGEARAVRRFYGSYPFKDEMLNCILEGVLYQYFRFWKGLLRLIFRMRESAGRFR